MELLRRYSKLPKLQIPTEIIRTERPASRPPSSIRRRLNNQQAVELCDQYRLGATTRNLSERYGIGKTAVTRLLRNHNVPLRHQGLSQQQVQHATTLYQSGKSVQQVANDLKVPSSSVYDALRRASTRLRSRIY